MLAVRLGQYQICAQPLGDQATILQTQRSCRVAGDQLYRLRQAERVAIVVCQTKRRIQQAGRIIIGREDI
ncbi:hypothetical protein D3C78_1407560 [compost metagenome]